MTDPVDAPEFCIVIPHYEHHAQLERFLPSLANADLPLTVVDDGSSETTVRTLSALLADYPRADLIKRESNGGKGAATRTGLATAQARGYSHIILVDADGQHDPADIVRLQTAATAAPKAIFSGNPQFGDDIPPARLYGREITNVLARLEAGNFALQDAMCGLRVYPVASTLRLANQCGNRTRMEMDTELLVRACWNGIEVHFLDTRVVYPDEGASHFRMGKDNVRLTLMHIRLLLAALVRVPMARFRGGSRPFGATNKRH